MFAHREATRASLVFTLMDVLLLLLLLLLLPLLLLLLLLLLLILLLLLLVVVLGLVLPLHRHAARAAVTSSRRCARIRPTARDRRAPQPRETLATLRVKQSHRRRFDACREGLGISTDNGSRNQWHVLFRRHGQVKRGRPNVLPLGLLCSSRALAVEEGGRCAENGGETAAARANDGVAGTADGLSFTFSRSSRSRRAGMGQRGLGRRPGVCECECEL